MAALHGRALPHRLRAVRDAAPRLLADRHPRHRRWHPRRPQDPGRLRRPRRGRADAYGARTMSTVLEVNGIRKRFGGITAVDGVSFTVNEGEILGIIGPNGCGKSTLFNCILGQLPPTEGEVKVDGKEVTGMRPSDLNRLGVSRTFQLLQVFPQLSVRE